MQPSAGCPLSETCSFMPGPVEVRYGCTCTAGEMVTSYSFGGHERSTAGQEGWHYSSVNAVVCETIVERQVHFQSSDCKWTSPFMNAFVCTNKHTETCRPSSLGGQESTAGPLRTEKEHSRGGQEMLTSGLSSADSSSCLLKRSETAGTF